MGGGEDWLLKPVLLRPVTIIGEGVATAGEGASSPLAWPVQAGGGPP